MSREKDRDRAIIIDSLFENSFRKELNQTRLENLPKSKVHKISERFPFEECILRREVNGSYEFGRNSDTC